MSSINACYTESKQYSNDIMNNVIKSLDAESIKYTVNKNKSEVTVNSDNYEKHDIIDIINKHTVIPKMVLSVLIDITKLNSCIFIRQKTK